MVPSDFFDFFVLYSNQDLDKLEVRVYTQLLLKITTLHYFTLHFYVYFVDKVVSSNYNLKPRPSLPVGENIIMLQYYV